MVGCEISDGRPDTFDPWGELIERFIEKKRLMEERGAEDAPDISQELEANRDKITEAIEKR